MNKLILEAVDACRCNKPTSGPLEFDINEDSTSLSGDFIYPEVDNSSNDIEELKEKAICELNHILDLLECGILPNLEMLLEEISLINIYEQGFRILS